MIINHLSRKWVYRLMQVSSNIQALGIDNFEFDNTPMHISGIERIFGMVHSASFIFFAALLEALGRWQL